MSYDLDPVLSMLVPTELILRNCLPGVKYVRPKPDSECTPDELARRIAQREEWARKERAAQHREALIENAIRDQFGVEGYDFLRERLDNGDY